MLTPEGTQWLLEKAMGMHPEARIATVEVAGAQLPVQTFDVIPSPDGRPMLRLTTVAEETAAVGEWTDRRVLTSDGVLLDEEADDLGRKILGAIWDVEVHIHLLSSPPT